MKKIVARMRGGLGNQLFIYACVKYIAEKIKGDYEIVLDSREYATYKIRNFEVLELLENTKVRLFDDKKDKSCLYEITRRIYHVAQKFLPANIPVSKSLAKKGLFYSKICGISDIEIIEAKETYLYGYFQDARMVEEVKESIKNELTFPKVTYPGLNPNVDHIAISIRCGKDYVDQGWPICSKEYFLRGIDEIITEKYQNKKVQILVFADDWQMVNNFDFKGDVLYIRNKTPIEQLSIMKECSDFVLSNSSFAWWGGFLGNKQGSIVIIPDAWFNYRENTRNSILCFSNTRVRSIK